MNNKLFFCLMIIMVFFSISAINASEINNTIDYSSDIVAISNSDEIISADLIENFTKLNEEITNNDVVNLDSNVNLDSDEASTFVGGIAINKDITINGNNNIINASNSARIFNIGNNANVILKDLTITGALTTSGHGGAIYMASGSLTVENCTFVDNTLRNNGAHGGAIHAADRTTLTIKNSLFKNNINTPSSSAQSWSPTSQYGGAIYCGNYATLTVTNTTFKDNAAIRGSYSYRNMYDGAISSFGANSVNKITNCTFINNQATNGIGAIEMRVGNITGCIFDDNYGTNDYPCVYFSSNANVIISHNVFLDDTTQVRARNSIANVVEEYNWWATNEPGNLVRMENTYQTPNKYIMMDIYNEGNIIKAGLIKDSNRNEIPNKNLLPIRDVEFTGDVDNTQVKTVDGLASTTYNGDLTNPTEISATIDGNTMTYTPASGSITSIEVSYVKNTTVGDDGNIIIQVLGDNGPVDGKIAVYLNDSKSECELQKGIALLNIGSTFDAGIYDIYYEYLGSSNYVPTMNKEKSDSKFEVEMVDVDISYTNDANAITFIVSHKVTPTGTITVKLGDLTKTFTLNQGTYTYNFGKELTDGTYDLNITYNGDKNHYKNTLIDTFDIVKQNVTIIYKNNGTSFEFNVTADKGVPTGSISVSFVGSNTVSRNLNLNKGFASYNFGTNLHNGSYNMTVIYNGDNNYEQGKISDIIQIEKFAAKINAGPIIIKGYRTNSNFVVIVEGEDGQPIPTGTISYPSGWSDESATLDSEGKGSLRWQAWTDPYGELMNESKTISYSGDSNYDPASITVLFQTTPSLSISNTINENNITFSFSGQPENKGIIYIKENDEDLGNVSASDYSFPSFKLDNVEMGEHTYEFIWDYGNGNNYTFTKSIVLRTPGESQWPVPGFDNQNSGNSNYTRSGIAYIMWNATVNNPISSAIIDSEGNIYIADDSNIKIFKNDGTLQTTTNSGSQGAISLIDDEYIFYVRPWSNIAAFDIGTFSGMGTWDTQVQWYTNSKYPVIKGPDGRYYLSVYFNNGGMPNQGKYLTMLRYQESDNQLIYDNVVIDSQPISSPVFGSDNIVWVTTVSGIRGVDITSDNEVFSHTEIGTIGVPVIDNNNIVYVFGKENTINALTVDGIVWTATVNNGIGSVMAIDNEKGLLYAVDKNGTLFSYDTMNNGESTEVYNIGANATSIIVDINSTVYVSDDKGNVLAIGTNNNLLWNISLNAPVRAPMSMDKNGIIYAVTANTLYALGSINETELTLEVEDEFTTLDDINVTVNMNSTFDGENITFTIVSENGYENTTNKTIVDGKAILNIANLKEGTYNVTAKYGGNTYYDEASEKANFTVSKVTPELCVNINNGTVFTNATITVTSTNCKGNVTVKVGEETFEDVVIGEEFTLPLLPISVYDVTVTYEADDVYNEAVNDTEKLEITKEDVELDPEVSIENNTVTVKLPENATGKVFLDVDGVGYYAPIENGEAIINIPELKPDTYEATLTYPGDENYNNASTTFDIEVPDLLDPELEVSVKDTEITITINENATGKIIATVGEISYVKDAADAPIVIDVSDLESGEYDVTVEYVGDEKFNNATATAEVTVPEVEPLDPELKVTVDGTVVTVSLNELASGYVVVSVDGDSLFFEYDGSPIVVECADILDPGKYPMDVFYSGDEVFASDNASVYVNIPEIELLDPELKLSIENTTITVSINENATGDVIISVGDISFVQSADELAPIDVSEYLTNGTYPVTVRYMGDENFTESVLIGGSVTVPEEPVVEPLNPELKLNIENTTITVSINEKATGDVIITVGDISFVQSADELAPIDVSEYLTNGTYPVTVRYVGDENFTGSVLIGGSVTVPEEPVIEPKDPQLKASAVNNTITVNVDKDATGNVLVDVDGQGYYAPIKNGQATVNVIGLDEGTYEATVTYVGDEAYKSANTTVAVTVPKKEDPTPEPVDPDANIEVTNTTASISLPKDATGYMLVDVDGKGYYAPVKDGKASIDLPELAPGNHTVTVTYTGDNKYKSANATETVTIDEEIETIIAEDLTKVEKAPDRFEATFTDADGKTLANAEVTFTLNGVTYTRTTDASGKASIGINLDAGNYTILVTNTVTKESKELKINVLSRFAVHNDLTKYFRNATQYVVKILDDEGNPAKAGEVVTFNINGVFYNRTADANGNVKLNINLNPGDYIITAEYKGCRVSNNIKVLPVLTGKDLTKKFGQPDQFEATLVDGQGKAYANQKVTFNINGVFYTRTTDSNGVAKLNINLQPGQYIITSYYNEAVTSNTVTVTA